MSFALTAGQGDMRQMVKRLLTALAFWYDEPADLEQHQRVRAVSAEAERSQTRAARAVAAYQREQVTLRRHS